MINMMDVDMSSTIDGELSGLVTLWTSITDSPVTVSHMNSREAMSSQAGGTVPSEHAQHVGCYVALTGHSGLC